MQVSTGKKRLGIDQFRSFFAGLFTGKKNKNKPSGRIAIWIALLGPLQSC